MAGAVAWAGLGWAGLGSAGLGWAGLGCQPVGAAWTWAGVVPHMFHEGSKLMTNEDAVRSETHTISIYPVLEGLWFRALGFWVSGFGFFG